MSDDDCDDGSNMTVFIVLMSILGVSVVGALVLCCVSGRTRNNVNNNQEVNIV